MHPEAAFLAGYATVLVVVAAGLQRLGRRSEVPLFHHVISGVVLAAALLLVVVSVARHHNPVELLVLIALLALISLRIVRLCRPTIGPRRSGARSLVTRQP